MMTHLSNATLEDAQAYADEHQESVVLHQHPVVEKSCEVLRMPDADAIQHCSEELGERHVLVSPQGA